MKLKVIIGIGLLFAVLISCQSEQELEFGRYYSAGNVIYQSKCQNCHGATGQGLQSLIPPLTDSVFLKANKDALACMIKYGLKGKLSLGGKTFEGEMPANDIPAVAIAEVLTYVTNSFSNKMGTVTTQQVDSALKECK